MGEGSDAVMFNEEYLNFIVPLLEEAGVKFEAGLSDTEIREIEAEMGFVFPPDLRLFLQYALPSGKYKVERSDEFPTWPDWRGDLNKIKRYTNVMAYQLADDVRSNTLHASPPRLFWMEGWGDPPDDVEAAIAEWERRNQEAPRLIRLFSHRHMPALPQAGNPVFSVYSLDTIIYGNDLADYFSREFGIPRPSWAVTEPRYIEFWSDLAN